MHTIISCPTHISVLLYPCKCKALYEEIVLQMYCEGYNTATRIQLSYFSPFHLHSSILVLQLAKDISVL